MKKVWMFCRRCAAYMMREHNSLFDILVLLSMVRLIDQHRYWDAAVLLLIAAPIAVAFKSMAGKLNDGGATIVNRLGEDPSFAKRVRETLNGER